MKAIVWKQNFFLKANTAIGSSERVCINDKAQSRPRCHPLTMPRAANLSSVTRPARLLLRRFYTNLPGMIESVLRRRNSLSHRKSFLHKGLFSHLLVCASKSRKVCRFFIWRGFFGGIGFWYKGIGTNVHRISHKPNLMSARDRSFLAGLPANGFLPK